MGAIAESGTSLPVGRFHVSYQWHQTELLGFFKANGSKQVSRTGDYASNALSKIESGKNKDPTLETLKKLRKPLIEASMI